MKINSRNDRKSILENLNEENTSMKWIKNFNFR